MLNKFVRFVFLLLLIILPQNFFAQGDNNFWVGILRLDGVLMPVALYVDGSWSTPWPKTDDQTSKEKPVSLNNIPKTWLGRGKPFPKAWYLWNLKGDLSEIEILKPVEYESHCEGNWGLLTDFPAQAMRGAPTPKLGMALSAKQNVHKMLELRQDALETGIITSFIRPVLNKLEGEEISKSAQKEKITDGRLEYPGHPVSQKEREKVDLSIKSYRSNLPIANQYIYYLEAQKSYPYKAPLYDSHGNKVANTCECDAISLLQGFILKKQDGKLVYLDKQFNLTDCDMKEVHTAFPFSIISLNDKGNFIIMQRDYYEAEDYIILRIDDSSLVPVVEVSGGGC